MKNFKKIFLIVCKIIFLISFFSCQKVEQPINENSSLFFKNEKRGISEGISDKEVIEDWLKGYDQNLSKKNKEILTLLSSNLNYDGLNTEIKKKW